MTSQDDASIRVLAHDVLMHGLVLGITMAAFALITFSVRMKHKPWVPISTTLLVWLAFGVGIYLTKVWPTNASNLLTGFALWLGLGALMVINAWYFWAGSPSAKN